MNKLLLPIGLGLAAFAVSYMTSGTTTGPTSVKLAAAAADIKAGQVISEEMVTSVSAPGGSAVGKSAVPYAERGVLLVGQTAKRSVPKGEMLLFEDVSTDSPELSASDLLPGEVAVQVPLGDIKCPAGLLQLNAQIGFVVVNRPPAPGLESLSPFKGNQPPRLLGPFRIVNIGGRTNALAKEARDTSNPAMTIGVAAKPAADGKFEGVAAELLQLIGNNSPSETTVITAIANYPTKKAN
jgi:hypothetical protein